MPRRYRKPQNPLREAIIVIIVVTAIFSLSLYSSLPPEKARYFLASCITVLVILAVGTLVAVIGAIQKRKRATRILNMVDIDAMTGLEFERYLVELLRSRGYKQVQLTEQYDLGVDIIAEKDSIRWGIQAKRYSSLVKAAAVRQVVTALNTYNCQRSMVITNSVYSRPAQLLAESNDCVLIDKEQLAEWVVEFQSSKR